MISKISLCVDRYYFVQYYKELFFVKVNKYSGIYFYKLYIIFVNIKGHLEIFST